MDKGVEDQEYASGRLPADMERRSAKPSGTTSDPAKPDIDAPPITGWTATPAASATRRFMTLTSAPVSTSASYRRSPTWITIRPVPRVVGIQGTGMALC